MSTESEVILARYRAVEKEADALGRVIGVRRLKPSEQTKIAGFCADLTGYDDITAPNGDKMQIPHRMPLLIAAAVCMIDEVRIPFARSRAELDAIYDRLDAEGLAAAGAAMARLSEAESTKDPIDEAKN
jgi:hypothetical protein